MYADKSFQTKINEAGLAPKSKFLLLLCICQEPMNQYHVLICVQPFAYLIHSQVNSVNTVLAEKCWIHKVNQL